MSLVPAIRTPLTPAQALGALQEALPSSFTRAGLDMVAAQSAVETARWTEMYGWNFGNVTPTAAQVAAGVDYFQHASTGSMRYRAYPDPVAGARAMTGWLESHGAYDAAQAGDLAGYMAALQAGSYLGTVGLTDGSGHTVSQADYTNYQNDIAVIMNELAAVTPERPPSGWSWLVWLGGLVGGGAALAAWKWDVVGPYVSPWLRAARKWIA